MGPHFELVNGSVIIILSRLPGELITYVEEAHDIDGNHGDDHGEEGHGDQALGDQLIILERNYQGDRCMEWHRRLTSSTRLHRQAQFVKIIKRSAMYLSSPSS